MRIFYFLFRHFIIIFLVTFSIHSFAQCLEENDVLLPEKPIKKSNSYGGVMASYNDYLLVSATHNDSLEFDGGVAYLYKLVAGQWEKKAELAASSYNFQMFFGRRMVIHDNIAIIAGNTFTPEGFHFDELFVYTKNNTDEWANATESYKQTIRDDLDATGLAVDKMVIHNDVLGVSYHTAKESNIAFYNIMPDGSLNFVSTLVGPKDKNGSHGGFGQNFDINSNIIAAGARSFKQDDSHGGLVFVYNLADVLNTANPLPVAHLIPENPDQQDFPVQVEIEGDAVFAANGYTYSVSGEYPANIYIFEKPLTGWADAKESATLTTQNKDFYGYFHTMKVQGDYVFLCRAYYGEDKIYGYKKNGGEWQDALRGFTIKKDKENEGDTRIFGSEIAFSGEYMVVSYQSGNSRFYPQSQDKIISYHASGGLFENIFSAHQEIHETTYSASEAYFGQSMSYSNNRIAIGAIGDEKKGENYGAVYIYDKDLATNDYVFSEVIRPPNGRPFDDFGYSVELADSLLFVSALYYDSLNTDSTYFNGSIGKVYQYRLKSGGWVLENTIYSPGNLSEDEIKHFGRSLSYSDNYLAVSQYYSGTSASNGKVHLFERSDDNQWLPVAVMTTKDQQGGDFFGRDIILKDSLLIVGTGNPEYGSTDEMRVYLFRKKGFEWESATEDAYLISSDKERFDRFGYSIDMHKDLIVVGAPGYHYGNTKTFAGKAYVFKRPKDGWNGIVEEAVILEPKESIEENLFGYDVFIDENQIVVGAASSINNAGSVWHEAGIDDLQRGKIYFFDPYSENDQTLDKRNERYIQISPNNRYLDGFGYAFEKSYDRVFVSAIYDNNESGYRAGGVYDLKFTTYIYSIEGPVCIQSEPFKIESNILGGTWSGDGIIDPATGMFDPGLIEKDGWTVVTYTAGDCTVSSSFYIGSPPQVTDKSNDQVFKCEGDETPLYVHYTSGALASTKWYYKQSETAAYQLIESNKDSIAAEQTGYYQVEIDNGYCSSVKLEFKVYNDDPQVSLNHSDYWEVCANSTDQLRLVSNVNIKNTVWYLEEEGSNTFTMLNDNEQITPRHSGLYFATYDTDICSYHSDTIEIYYNNLNIQIEKPETICTNSYQLEAIPQGGVWYGSGVNNEGIISANQLGSGYYQASYKIQQGGCLFEKSVDYEVLLLPHPQLDIDDNQVCYNQPIELDVTNNQYDAKVAWYNVDENEVMSGKHNLITDIPGNYIAKYILKGCESTSDTVTLAVRQDSLFVPNVVTYNHDGSNDDFRIYTEGSSHIKLSIFNRWGDLIYFDDDSKIEWIPDETAAGVYYWTVQYLNCYNQKKQAKGWVQVMLE